MKKTLSQTLPQTTPCTLCPKDDLLSNLPIPQGPRLLDTAIWPAWPVSSPCVCMQRVTELRVSGFTRVVRPFTPLLPVSPFRFYLFCATLRRAKTGSPLRHGHRSAYASKSRFFSFLLSRPHNMILSEVQIVTPRKTALRFSLSDDGELLQEVVSKDRRSPSPLPLHQPVGEVPLGMTKFNATFAFGLSFRPRRGL